jgi:hypothetical protein
MSTTDTRKVEGGKVHALACHVTDLAKYQRRYGSNAKTKLVNGRVVAVHNIPTATGRISAKIKAMYMLDKETTMEAELNIRSVKRGWIDGPTFDGLEDSVVIPHNEAPLPGIAPETISAKVQQLTNVTAEQTESPNTAKVQGGTSRGTTDSVTKRSPTDAGSLYPEAIGRDGRPRSGTSSTFDSHQKEKEKQP